MALLSAPPAELRGFPRRSLRSSVDLHRIHPAGLAPWWFSSDGSGRFDLPPPLGTCYLALSPAGAFVEVFRDFTLLDAADVSARRISLVRVRDDLVLADCTSSRSRGFGVTAAMHSTPDHATTQAWAAAFRGRAFDGVRFFCGHDPAQRQVGIALFGAVGEATLPVVETTRLGDDVLEDVGRRFGIHVLPGP